MLLVDFYTFTASSILLVISAVAILQSWKDGSIVTGGLFLGMGLYSVSGLILFTTGTGSSVVWYLMVASVICVAVSLLIFAPMTMRKSRRR